VIVGKIPVSVRFHHCLAFGALPHGRDGQSIEFYFSVVTLLDEKHLAAAAGHLCRFGIEPAWTRRVARTGFFELAGDFPRSFIFWLICGSQRCDMGGDTCKKRTREEQFRFHAENFTAACAFPTRRFCRRQHTVAVALWATRCAYALHVSEALRTATRL